MEGLVFRYVVINSFTELDNLKWDNSSKGVTYTMSNVLDYDSKIHPSSSGCVEIKRYGGLSTLQIFYTGGSKMYIRTFLQAGNNPQWSAWIQV
mgnify:CR=1 FL=1